MMTSADPTLLVLQLSDSFSDAWPRLARTAGLRFERTVDAAPFHDHRHEAIGIIAAGGEEARIEGALRRINGSPLEIAAVGGQADHRLVARVMQAGASEFFVLAQDIDALSSWLARQRDRLLTRHNGRLPRPGGAEMEFPEILGESPALRAALDQVARLIPHPQVTVLIAGETGTGKELLARALHENGPRHAAPFVDVNCAAIPETLLEAELFGHERGAFTDAVVAKPGLFEIANGGTLFLDEIGHMPFRLQGKLLRVLEERRTRRIGGTKSVAVDVRVIAATNVNLARAVRRGQFREDLYYRLNVVPISLPPLRERPDDVVLLARHFLSRYATAYGMPHASFSPAAERALRARRWPGNVRELRNVVERAVLMARGSVIDAASLQPEPEDPPVADMPPRQLRGIIRNAVRETLEQCGGNKSDAARRLGISRTRLQRLIT
ncbi:MAG TPA: sigma-54 dependent transcriptional regulator [Gemmatimonadaceae bacterium]|jgi:DNA-binding NtrC family response regulator|nr:sigma-54 dependent transcriptional regulator [Gemmatimonadaceae bacterium]